MPPAIIARLHLSRASNAQVLRLPFPSICGDDVDDDDIIGSWVITIWHWPTSGQLFAFSNHSSALCRMLRCARALSILSITLNESGHFMIFHIHHAGRQYALERADQNGKL